MFSAATSRRSRLAYSTLALLLAGAVNATSFFAFGQHITHMTGHVTAVGEAVASGQWGGVLTADVLTDIGIQLVRMVVWVRDGARERGLRGIWHKVLDLPSAEQFERTRLHLGLALAFLTGSILGAGLYLRYGASAMALPCVVLVVVMALDISPAGSHAPAASL